MTLNIAKSRTVALFNLHGKTIVDVGTTANINGQPMRRDDAINHLSVYLAPTQRLTKVPLKL